MGCISPQEAHDEASDHGQLNNQVVEEDGGVYTISRMRIINFQSMQFQMEQAFTTSQ